MSEEYASDTHARCPHCRGIFEVKGDGSDSFEVRPGEHGCRCTHCDKFFMLVVDVSHTFTSPPLCVGKAATDGTG